MARGEDEPQEVVGQADVPHQARQSRDQPRGLDAPDGLDRAAYLGWRHYWFASTSWRSCSFFSRSSGVNSSPKSSTSNTGRISTVLSTPSSGFGMRFTHSIASSIDFTCHTQ